jgi:dUTP pyrophosphatase
MQISYVRLNDTVPVPVISYEGDAGFDLCAAEEVTLQPGGRAKIRSGLSFEIPLGYVGLIWDKSGVSNNHGIKTLGGVIDSGYRGEVLIGMINLSNESYTFKVGEKVAQMLIQKIEHPTFIETEQLSDTTRGAAGFGSSGK